MSATAKAREYERRFPGAVADESQRAERMERLELREERRAHRRTGRTRGIVVPVLPWRAER
jgi:hypothetical protein